MRISEQSHTHRHAALGAAVVRIARYFPESGQNRFFTMHHIMIMREFKNVCCTNVMPCIGSIF